jgi:ribosomal protein S3
VKKTDHGIVVIIIYVDDLLVIGNSDANIFDLKKLLKQKFEMKDWESSITFSALK